VITSTFRFLSDDDFSALDVKAKAIYIISAEQELQRQRDLLRRYRDDLAVQVAAMVELRGSDQPPAGSPSQ